MFTLNVNAKYSVYIIQNGIKYSYPFIMDKEKVLIGRKIKEIRKKNKLTQENFCEQIGIEPSSLSNIENGKSFPSMQTVLRIMEKLGATPDDFFNFEYLQNENDLETGIIKIVKNLPYEKKQILYRIIKQFDI